MLAQTVHDRRQATARAVLVSAVAAIGGFLVGFDTAVINGAVNAIQLRFALTPVLTGLAVSCALLGSAVGAWCAGPAANRLGRIRVMVIAALLFAVSAIGLGLASAVGGLIAWRTLAGAGVGIASVIAPAYIAEISPANLRGRLGSLQQLAIVSGIFVALLSDAFFAQAAGGQAKRCGWASRPGGGCSLPGLCLRSCTGCSRSPFRNRRGTWWGVGSW